MVFPAGLAGVGFFLLLLIVLPSIFCEIAPARAASRVRPILLGDWLSSGFRHFRWTVIFLWIAAFAVPLASLVYGVWRYYSSNPAGDVFLLYLYNLPPMAKGGRPLLSFGGIFAGPAAVLAGFLV